MLVYNPPCGATGIHDQFEELLESKLLNRPTIIIGDFNIDWSTTSSFQEKFETLMSLNNFRQLITEYTRIFKNSKTIIDLLFTNTDNLIADHRVVKCDISDHYMLWDVG